MGYFSAGERAFSWVEVGPSDPTALDWRLHITDALTGADRVVAIDPGVRITSKGPWTYSYRPMTWFDDRSLLYTIMVPGDGAPSTQIRRLTGQSTEVLLTVPDAATNAIARLTADDRSVAWVEFELPKTDFNVKTTLVVRDNATGVMKRMALSSNLTLRLAGESILIGAQDGLYVTDRDLTAPLRRISQASNVESIMLVGAEVVFRSNSDHIVRAIAPGGGTATDLDSDVTVGPFQGNGPSYGTAAWFRFSSGQATIGVAQLP